MKHATRLAPRLLVVLAVACAALFTGGGWLVVAGLLSLNVLIGLLLWRTRGTFHNVFLVALFFPILLPLAALEWLRQRAGRPQPG